MRLSSVVFPAPRKPVRIVIGTALQVWSMISIVDVCSRRFARITLDLTAERPALARRDTDATPLFLEFAHIDSHHLRHLDEIDQLGVRKRRDRLTVDIRRIVQLRINFEVARQLLLLLLTRQPRLRDDSLAGRKRQRIAEEQRGRRQGLAREIWKN